MVSKDAMLDGFDRAIAKFALLRAEDVEQSSWREAFNKQVSLLIWRALRLAIRLDVASPQFNPGDNPFDLGSRVRRDCLAALNELEPTDDKSSHFQKVSSVIEVLDAIHDAAETLQSWTGTDPTEIFFLANRAIDLGQAEVGLAFAEQGFWDEVARWRAQRVGRPVGTTAKWSKEALPILRSWVEEEPDISTEGLMSKLSKWLEGYAKANPSTRIPEHESLRRSLDRMHDSGKIVLPTRQKVGQ